MQRVGVKALLILATSFIDYDAVSAIQCLNGGVVKRVLDNRFKMYRFPIIPVTYEIYELLIRWQAKTKDKE